MVYPNEETGIELRETSPPSSQSTAHLTPDSDDDWDLDDEDDPNSFKLRSHRKNLEKFLGGPAEDDEPEDYNPTRRRGSQSTAQSFELYTPDEERAVVRKFDRKLVLFVAVLYLLSFLDRSNIGNARLAGLETDLSLTSSQFSWVLSAFYLSYVSFSFLSLLFATLPAHILLTCIVLSWGILASLQSVTTTFTSLLILRFLLGIGEAGFTGIPFFLSFFFKRNELALRTGYFVSAAPLAMSFASTLAWAIVKLSEKGPIAPWRLLFLVEGFPSCLIAVLVYYLLPDSPSTASYLTPREQKVARLRLRHSSPRSTSTLTKGLQWREIVHTLCDLKSWLTAAMFFLANMAFASLPIFLPTIISHMGHTPLTSQALAAPPYLCAFVSVLITARLSDRHSSRSPFIIFHALLSCFGYTSLAILGHYSGISPWIRYFAIFPACIGFFSTITIIITWTVNNEEGESGRGMANAMLQAVGQCGPFFGIRLYPNNEGPYYVHGMGVCAVAMAGVAGLAAVLRWWLGRCNRKAEGAKGTGRYEIVGGEEGEAGEGLVSKVGDGGERGEGAFRFML